MKSLMLFTLTLILTTALALLPATAQEGRPLHEKVLEKYRETLQREDIQELLPDVLEGLKAPNVQELLNPATITLVVANPDLLTQFVPGIDPAFITLLKTDAEIQAMLNDRLVQALLQQPAELDELVSALDVAGPPVVEPPVEMSPIHFPDANLANAIRRNFLLPDEAEITMGILRNLTVFDPGQLQIPSWWLIADLTGLEHATNLTRLGLGGTSVSDISALAHLIQLEELWLTHTAVSDVSALANLTQLERLELGGTAVSDIAALANLTKLTRLYLNDTAVSDIAALVNLTNLRTLELRGCPLSPASLRVHIPALQAKGVEVTSDNDIHIPDTNLANAIREKFVSLKAELSALAKLGGKVRLAGTNVNALDFVAQLGEGQQITSVGMGLIGVLEVPGKGIADLTGLQHATSLRVLYLGREKVNNEWRTNPIEDISALANLTELNALDLSYTAVLDVSAVANLTNLEWLDLTGTNVSNISAVANLTKLEPLNLSYTDVSDISAVANLTNLEWLDLTGTNVSNISAVANLTQLETLDLTGTNVSDISALANLTQLEWLYLTGTDVSDVSALANLTQLKELSLHGTDVSDVSALANLTQLKELSLNGTDVSDVSALANLPQLKVLDLRGAPLSQASYMQVIALRKRGLSVSAPEPLPVTIDGLKLDSDEKSTDLGHRLPKKGGNAFILFGQNDEYRRTGYRKQRVSLVVLGEKVESGVYNTCGPASLEMVFHYYGKRPTMAEIFDEGGIHTVWAGTSPSEMKQALNELGVPAYYYDEDSNGYSDDPLGRLRRYVDGNRPPCILYQTESGELHWSVVVGYAINKDGNDYDYLIANPAGESGPHFGWWTEDDLDGAWSFEKPWGDSTGAFKTHLADTFVIDPYTAIVPKRGASASEHFGPTWTDLQIQYVEGDLGVTAGTVVAGIPILGRVINKVFEIDVREWGKEELKFEHAFDSYKASAVKLFSFGGKATLEGHEKSGDRSVKIWGDIEDGVAVRGRLWVFVRTYRRTFKGPQPEPKTRIVAESLGAPSGLSALPAETSLLPNYPNPFNPETWIPYQLAEPAEVQVSIYSVDGRLVRKLDLGQMPAGVYRSRARAAYWNGRNAQGEPVASGIYFYTLTAGEFFATRKMVIRK